MSSTSSLTSKGVLFSSNPLVYKNLNKLHASTAFAKPASC